MTRTSGGRASFSIRRGLRHSSACSWVLLLLWAQHASAQQIDPRNTMGAVGLVEMPSARMAPDGSLTLGASFFENTEHYNFSFQVLPWLETNFRYSGLNNFNPSYPIYWDRSFGFKARLWEETAVFPSVAIGVNDLVGTGIYSGEYLVATKRIGAIDTTVGIGWGRLAATDTIRNPLTFISSSFETRRYTATDVGQFSFSQYFHGPDVGIFGGMVWHTPIDNLNLIVEYSSDDYTQERQAGNFTPRNQVNFGASYQLWDKMTIGLGWLYGRSVMGSISFQLDPKSDSNTVRLAPDPVLVQVRSDEEQLQALEKEISGRRTPVRVATPPADMSAMADALWRRLPAVEDIAVHGNTLVVAVSNADPRAACVMIAGIAAGYDSGLDGAVVTRSGAPAANCAFASHPPSPGLMDLAATPNGISLIQLTATPLVIDAGKPATPPNPARARATILAAARQQDISILALTFEGSDAVVYYSNERYLHEKDAIDRLVRILMADAPSDIERFRLIASPDGQTQREFDIFRSPTERQYQQEQQISVFDESASSMPAPVHNPILAAAERGSYPRFSWSVFPQVRQELFDPLQPFGVQLLAAAQGSVELISGLSVTLEAEASIYDNFNNSRISDSVLPHVRTDFLTYLSKGKNGIGQFQGEYDFHITPTLYAAVRAGYLESMFAGAGGELLWRPEGQRWALGADMYEVEQRDFDRLFGLQPYHVFTGHVSIYYQSPWYQLNFKLMAGQYLAGDRGATLEVTRRFSTGVEIGAFVTKTNVSAAQFGEGSFDKGFIIRLPLEWSLPINTQAELSMILRPIQRDGGQRLEGDTRLFEQTRQTSQMETSLAALKDN